MPSPEPIPTREIFLHLGTGPQVAFYVLGGLASVTFIYGFWRRYKKYRRGRAENRFDNLGGRIARAFVTIITNATVRKGDRFGGIEAPEEVSVTTRRRRGSCPFAGRKSIRERP